MTRRSAPDAAGAAVTSCKRHRRGELLRWIPVDNDDGTRWAIGEVHCCKVCGQRMEPRIAPGTIRHTKRETLLAYGLAATEIDALFPPSPPAAADRPAVALACWPFPVSTRYPKVPAPGPLMRPDGAAEEAHSGHRMMTDRVTSRSFLGPTEPFYGR